jgi:hypothetical protein
MIVKGRDLAIDGMGLARVRSSGGREGAIVVEVVPTSRE